MTIQKPTAMDWLISGGEMGQLIRSMDWSVTSLGAIESWSQSLRTATSICLNSRFPMVIWWGRDLILLYNDAWQPILGNKHPTALGLAGSEVWAEMWDIIGAQLQSVLETGQATWSDDLLLPAFRYGYLEEAYFTYSYSPIFIEDGSIGGAFTAVAETTQRVIGERRMVTLRLLAAQVGLAKTIEQACRITLQTLAENPEDIPFAALYRLENDQTEAVLHSSTLQDTSLALPTKVSLAQTQSHPWLFRSVVQHQEPVLVDHLADTIGEIPAGVLSVPLQQALFLPLLASGQEEVVGILVLGVNPGRILDDDYRNFFKMVTGHIATAIANANAYEEERKRAEALAEIDRAKTAFFSNVSHEFRTPLTLMLAPLESTIANLDGTIPPSEREQLQLVQRNGMRLLKLVNSLLDFSRIESVRVQVSYEPTDLATYTTELASTFRSLIERVGMSLVVECPTLPEAIYVDREMWEKIVLNLLSNAFKFTLAGTITVRLQWVEKCVELTVSDTGVGILPEEFPHLFERFHRVKNSQGRSFEGSGIGLSLVQELIKLHGGTIEVSSIFNQGSCFTVRIPTGTAHLPHEQICANSTLTSMALGSMPYVEEAQRWLSSANGEWALENGDTQTAPYSLVPTAQILLVDDNADMRDYIRRLLSASYTVESVADGIAALNAIQNNPPDLILTDVMMPGMDGFELLRSLRSNPTIQDIPIILLSARAGEESRIEGLEAGADDYLIKPFSARELLARVEASLKLARLRSEASEKERTILERVTDAFMALDLDFRFTYANVAAEGVARTPLEAILGKTMWESFPATIGTQFEFQYRRALTEQVAVEFEEYYTPFDLWVEVQVYPSPTGLSLFFRDINGRKRAEALRLRIAEEREQLLQREQAAREQAETANRIKDEFLAVLSHELRSPLNPILGWASLLQTHKFDEAKKMQALQVIERNAKLQSRLIEDLLDISRILQGKLSLNVAPVDLTSTIESAIETVRLAAEVKAIQIQTMLDPDIGKVLGDSNRLQQIVWNLLSNAVKFTNSKGRIEIRLFEIESQAQITVSDTGVGIDPNFLPYVFDYFRQADSTMTRKFGGLGLGLAIVRQIVELHGGTVQADSPGEGQGATFTVRLPLMPLSTETSQDSKSPPTLNLQGTKILIVDDDPDTEDFVTFLLEQHGAIVTAVNSAAAVLMILPQMKPDVLLCDVGMPDIDGYTLLREIRTLEPAQGGQIPAIALTAYAGEINQRQAIEAGFVQHIAKPLEPAELIRAIVLVTQSDQFYPFVGRYG